MQYEDINDIFHYNLLQPRISINLIFHRCKLKLKLVKFQGSYISCNEILLQFQKMSQLVEVIRINCVHTFHLNGILYEDKLG